MAFKCVWAGVKGLSGTGLTEGREDKERPLTVYIPHILSPQRAGALPFCLPARTGAQGAGPLIGVQGLVPGGVPGQRPGPPEAYLQQGKKRPYKTTENFFMQKMPFWPYISSFSAFFKTTLFRVETPSV